MTYVFNKNSLKNVLPISSVDYRNTPARGIINTIPGSYAHYLFDNYTFAEILDKCIDYEIFANQCKNDKIAYFPSSVLKSSGVSLKK